MRRRLIDKTQKRARRKKRFREKLNTAQTMTFSAEELIIHREHLHGQTQALKQALNQLSGTRREILCLKYYEGLSYEEIRHIMVINYQTARNYIYEGLEALRDSLGKNSVSIALAVTGIPGVIYVTQLLFSLC